MERSVWPPNEMRPKEFKEGKWKADPPLGICPPATLTVAQMHLLGTREVN